MGRIHSLAMATFLQGKVALITGGASGLGYQIVKELLENGLKGAVILDVNETKGRATEKEFNDKFGPTACSFIQTNVANETQMKDAFKSTVNLYQQLDIVINNAAIINEVNWKQCLDINLGGCISGTKLAIDTYLPKYKSGPEGLIVNVASIAAVECIPMTPVYGATKHGIISLGRSFGVREHYDKTKVRIVTICPGHMTTPMILEPNPEYLHAEYQQRFNIKEYMKKFPLQGPEHVAKCAIDIMARGENGSAWIVEDTKPAYQIKFQDKQNMKKN